MGSDLKANCHAAIYGVLFDFNKSTLQPASDPVLQQILDLLKKNPTQKIEVKVDTVWCKPLSRRYSLYQGNLQGTCVGHRSRSCCKFHYVWELCSLSEAERHLEQGISEGASGNSIP